MTDWPLAYREHAPALLAFLVSRLRRREDAEDLLQETFVRAIRAEGELRDASKLRSYLMSIAYHLMISHLRRRRPLLFSEASGQEEHELEPVSLLPSPDGDFAISDLERRVGEVLDQMKPALRRAFELAVLTGRSYREIAAETGWSMAQVKINVYRARQRAIAGLGDYLSEKPENQS